MLWKCGFYPWRYDSLLIIPFLFNFIYIANLCIWPWGATLAHLQPQPRARKNAHSPCVVSVPKKNQPIELNDYQLVALTSLTRLSMSRTPYNPDYNHSQDPFPDFSVAFITIKPLMLKEKLARMRVPGDPDRPLSHRETTICQARGHQV